MLRMSLSCLSRKIDLYNPKCGPEGEVVVDSFHTLKRLDRSSRVIDRSRVLVRCWQLRRTVRVYGFQCLVGMLPSRIESASGESAAQLSWRRCPVVNGVPAHWLKCF